jgi:exosortase A
MSASPTSDPDDLARRRRWKAASVAFAVALAGALAAYAGTIASMVHVWSHSDTFAYGFFVAPICLYLLWRSRGSFASLEPRPAPLAILALVPLGAGWILGRASSLLFVEQLSFVAMIPVLTLALFGRAVTRRAAFPLCFLFFAVPFGDNFQPALMGITADLAETALRWTGVAVAREGLYLTTTTGRWHVVESCSGLRFTVAGVVLATFFAYLTYRSQWKRLLFVAGAVVVSILANGVRAYVLILIGHVTDMRRGQGFDHYAYGWLVFTAAMVSYFMAGSAWRDREEALPAGGGAARPLSGSSVVEHRAGPRGWAAPAGLALAILLAWPAYDAWRVARAGLSARVEVTAPAAPSGWVQGPEDSSLWRPFFHGAASTANRTYHSEAGTAQCYIGYYADQRQGKELLHKKNTLFDVDDDSWHIVREGPRQLSADGSTFAARETVLRVPGGHWVLWHWYWIPDAYTTSPLQAKWLQARSTLLGHPDHAAVVVLGATGPTTKDAETLLARFATEILPEVRRSLRGAYRAR